MSNTSLIYFTLGTLMISLAVYRFGGVMAEGMFEYYRGRFQKIDRTEQPTTYWARVALMASSCAAGAMLISHGTQLLHP